MAKMKLAYKILAVGPGGQLLSMYDGSPYQIGVERRDDSTHGLSVHATEAGAVLHAIPGNSACAHLPRVLVRVGLPADAVLRTGEKTLVAALTVLRVVRVVTLVRCVRVSSAHAAGNAGNYPYWGPARYIARLRLSLGRWVHYPQESAPSARRAVWLAERDARAIAATEGRVMLSDLPSVSV